MTTAKQPSPHLLSPRMVTMINGQATEVLTAGEAEYYEKSRDSYMTQNRFDNNTDLRDLDRLLLLELMMFRLQQWLFGGRDYDGDFLEDERKLADSLKVYSDQISKIKQDLNITRKARDAAAAEGNFAEWLSQLKRRAGAFGVHRQRQLTAALTLMNDLSFIVTTYDRSDQEEREKLGFESAADIVDWVRTRMLPEFRELDEHFRTHEQSMWVRDM